VSDETPRNIEIFNRIVVRLLGKLYESFPVPISLDSGHIAAEAMEGFTEDEGEIFNAILSVSHETALFLREEGLITFQGSINLLDGKMHSARLTMKGLALLGRIPEQIDPDATGQSLGEQMRAAADRGASDYVAGLVGQFFSASVSAGWRAFTAG
jgi:hypothetical protein